MKGHLLNFKRVVTRWVPLALWVAFIFVMSSITYLPGDYSVLPRHSDKVVHFIEYLVLAILLYRGLNDDGSGRIRVVMTALVLIGVGIAGLDELYQSMVPGRDSSVADLAMDITGVVTGAAITFSRWKRLNRGVERA